MALAVKGSRLITIDGTGYRWRLRRRSTHSQMRGDTPLIVAVELAGDSRCVLTAAVCDVSHPASLLASSSLIVRPALVAAVIRMALSRGWQPTVPGRQFRLRVASGDLPAEVKTEMTPGDPWARLGL